MLYYNLIHSSVLYSGDLSQFAHSFFHSSVCILFFSAFAEEWLHLHGISQFTEMCWMFTQWWLHKIYGTQQAAEQERELTLLYSRSYHSCVP